MADEKNIAGHEGTLARYVDGAWKPVGCLTSSAFTSTMNMLEKVNMCTAGVTVQSPNNITRGVQIEGEVIDTTVVGGQDVKESLQELYDAQDASLTSKTPDQWRLSRGPLGYRYFKGYISDLSDNFAAGEDATFSATLTVQDKPTETDPNIIP